MNNKRMIILIIGIIAGLVIGGFITYSISGSPVDEEDKNTVLVRIEQGSGTGQIATALLKEDLIRSDIFSSYIPR